MLLRLSGRRLATLTLALVAGCGTPVIPEISGTLVGESAHFRLFVDPDFDSSICRAAPLSTRWRPIGPTRRRC
jgi:hypothetical protein